MERALRLDGSIPGTSYEFVKSVSSRSHDMRRHLQQSSDRSGNDVLEANPWRDCSKPVFLLTHGQNQLHTGKTRRNRSEVGRKLGMVFFEAGKSSSSTGKHSKESRSVMKSQMLVEDAWEGVLVFEDETEGARCCHLLQGGGQDCEGVAGIEASSGR